MFRSIALCLLTCCCLVTSTLADRPPNIIFIFADDMGFGDLNCHRDEAFQSAPRQPNGDLDIEEPWRGKVHTPHLDRMASEGSDFTQFMVANPVCSPSRVAMMTGHFPSRHRVHQHFASHADNVARGMPDYLDPNVPMLPRMLQQAGYRTGHFGKWHLSGGSVGNAPPPTEYGFDRSAVYVGGGPHVFDGTQYAALAKTAQHAEPASYLSIAATDHAVKFIRESRERPFYVNLWLHETHHVVSARPEDRLPYQNVPEPYQTYYGAVTRADAQVGRILDVINELQLDSQTLIIFSSDNGPELFSSKRLQFSVGSTAGMRGRKRSLMMGGLCVPFIVRWPGRVPAGRVDQETSLTAVDLVPTLLSVAGVDPPQNYDADGENVMAAFSGQPFERKKPIFWFWQGNHGGDNWPIFACRDGDYGLVVDKGNARFELYDLVRDRYQQTNLANSQKTRTRDMMMAINDWRLTLPKLPAAATQPARPAKVASKPNIDRKAIFARKDTDKDGFLSLEEFSKNINNPPPAETRFKRFDTNHDGRLNEREFVGKN